MGAAMGTWVLISASWYQDRKDCIAGQTFVPSRRSHLVLSGPEEAYNLLDKLMWRLCAGKGRISNGLHFPSAQNYAPYPNGRTLSSV